jgi:hypothetical protein
VKHGTTHLTVNYFEFILIQQQVHDNKKNYEYFTIYLS